MEDLWGDCEEEGAECCWVCCGRRKLGWGDESGMVMSWGVGGVAYRLSRGDGRRRRTQLLDSVVVMLWVLFMLVFAGIDWDSRLARE